MQQLKISYPYSIKQMNTNRALKITERLRTALYILLPISIIDGFFGKRLFGENYWLIQIPINILMLAVCIGLFYFQRKAKK